MNCSQITVAAAAFAGLFGLAAAGCSHSGGNTAVTTGGASPATQATSGAPPAQAQAAQAAMMQGRAADAAKNQAAMRAAGLGRK